MEMRCVHGSRGRMLKSVGCSEARYVSRRLVTCMRRRTKAALKASSADKASLARCPSCARSSHLEQIRRAGL
eukprot:scaffold93712_cov28-Tisochrysis_lutea.AAC.3